MHSSYDGYIFTITLVEKFLNTCTVSRRKRVIYCSTQAVTETLNLLIDFVL